jgi:hypothetical protein
MRFVYLQVYSGLIRTAVHHALSNECPPALTVMVASGDSRDDQLTFAGLQRGDRTLPLPVPGASSCGDACAQPSCNPR